MPRPSVLNYISHLHLSIASWLVTMSQESIDDPSFTISELEIPTEVPDRPGKTGVNRSRRTYASFPQIVQQAIPTIKAKENIYSHVRLNDTDEIRLVLLHKEGNDSGPIIISFVVTSLKNNRYPYEALSYHWGPWDSGHSVRVYSSDASKPAKGLKAAVMKVKPPKILVRDNLHAVLQRFRRKDRSVLLWIDALCIDQTHSEEKNLQVSRMADIYSRAKNVCIWLGEGDDRDADGLKFAKRILDLTNLDQIITTDAFLPQWEALSNLMKRPWFSRRWVIQELAMARSASIHCGSASINWGDFADAVAIFVAKFDNIKDVSRTSKEHMILDDLGDVAVLGANVLVNANSNLFRRSSMGGDSLVRVASLETLMATLSSFEATDSRDAVYALLSIAKEFAPINASYNKPALIQADYSKSTKDVYIDFTLFCIKTSGSLDIICRPWAPTERLNLSAPWVKKPGNPETEFPSWVPLLSGAPFGGPEDELNGRVNGDTFVGLPDHKFYKAAGPTRAKFWLGTVSEHNDRRELRSRVNSSEATMTGTTLQAEDGDNSINEEGMEQAGASRNPPQEQSTTPEEKILRSPARPAADPCGLEKKTKPPPPPKPKFDGTLYVKGYEIDTVEQVSPRVPEGIVGRECLKMGGWESNQDVLTSVPEELWRTMIADRGPLGRNVPSWYHRACLHCLANSTTNGDLNTEVLIAKGKPSMAVEFLRRVQRAVWNRVFIRSKKQKLFGLAPWRTEMGDVICILLGCSVPVILRKRGSRPAASYYELIGESYIHSMMDGEALMNKSEAEFEEQCDWFKLK